MNGEQLTWTLGVPGGIIGPVYLLVSDAAPYFINDYIKKDQKFFTNSGNEEMLPKVDYIGSVSGYKVDKLGVFDYKPGLSQTPAFLSLEALYKRYNTKF